MNMHACTHAHMHAHMHTCTHTCTHAHTHAHMHTHMHTCTHAHTLSTFDFVCILTRLCPLNEPGGSDTSSPLDWSSTLSKVNPGSGHYWHSVFFTLHFPCLDCCDVFQVWLGIFSPFSVVILFLLVILSCSPPLCLSLSFFRCMFLDFLGYAESRRYEFFFPHGFFAPQVLWTCL